MIHLLNFPVLAFALLAGLLHCDAGGEQPDTGAGKSHSASDGSEHPLLPLVKIAETGLTRISAVNTYTCELVCQERVDGKLKSPKTVFAKVRHDSVRESKPEITDHSRISLYLQFKSPESVQGRELLFCNAGVDDPDQWRIVVRKGGKRLAFLTAELSPTCELAMKDCRYPITEFGLKRLIERIHLVAKQECQYPECEVAFDNDVVFAGKACTMIEITHSQHLDHFNFHLARIYIDNDLQLPIHFSAYDWPAETGTLPDLNESYTYRDIKLNVPLSDSDFDRANPAYAFK